MLKDVVVRNYIILSIEFVHIERCVFGFPLVRVKLLLRCHSPLHRSLPLPIVLTTPLRFMKPGKGNSQKLILILLSVMLTCWVLFVGKSVGIELNFVRFPLDSLLLRSALSRWSNWVAVYLIVWLLRVVVVIEI